MNDPEYTRSGQPANLEAAAVCLLRELQTLFSEMQPLTDLQRREKQRLADLMNSARVFLPESVGVPVVLMPVPVPEVMEPEESEIDWSRGREARYVRRGTE